MKTNMLRLCIAGNLLGLNPGYVTTQGQIIADLFASDGYDVIAVSSKRNRLLRLGEIVWTIFRERNTADVLIVEVYSRYAFILADVSGFFARLFRMKSIFVLHGGGLPEFAVRYPRWTRRVLERPNMLAAPSQFIASQIEPHGFSVKVIPNVIETAAYPTTLRERISPKLFWMRSFHSIYNPHMAIDVFSRIKAEYPTATLVMAGVDKGMEAEIKRSARERGLINSIRFPGFLDHAGKIKEFSQADIYLNTNRIDNMPVSVLEAWAMGLPVVATNVGGLPYLIEHEVTGLLVNAGDVDEMVDAVRSLLNDPDLTRRLSSQGRKKAELYSWECVRKNWECVFEQLMGTPGYKVEQEAAGFLTD